MAAAVCARGCRAGGGGRGPGRGARGAQAPGRERGPEPGPAAGLAICGAEGAQHAAECVAHQVFGVMVQGVFTEHGRRPPLRYCAPG